MGIHIFQLIKRMNDNVSILFIPATTRHACGRRLRSNTKKNEWNWEQEKKKIVNAEDALNLGNGDGLSAMHKIYCCLPTRKMSTKIMLNEFFSFVNRMFVALFSFVSCLFRVLHRVQEDRERTKCWQRQFDILYVYFWPRKITIWSVTFKQPTLSQGRIPKYPSIGKSVVAREKSCSWIGFVDARKISLRTHL